MPAAPRAACTKINNALREALRGMRACQPTTPAGRKIGVKPVWSRVAVPDLRGPTRPTILRASSHEVAPQRDPFRADARTKPLPSLGLVATPDTVPRARSPAGSLCTRPSLADAGAACHPQSRLLPSAFVRLVPGRLAAICSSRDSGHTARRLDSHREIALRINAQSVSKRQSWPDDKARRRAYR